MLGDMDPEAEMDKVIDQMKTSYQGIIDARVSFSEYDQYLSLLPVIVNGFSIVLILLTSVGVILGFINLTSLGSMFVCISTSLSGVCLLLS